MAASGSGFARQMVVAGATDPGRVRENNEDCFMVDAGLGLLVVADGLGGHQAGEVASRLAIETIAEHLRRKLTGGSTGDDTLVDDATRSMTPQWTAPGSAQVMEWVGDAVREASSRIRKANARYRSGNNGAMGTTASGLFGFTETGSVVLFHVGDSRIYRLRGGELNCLTRDQTLYQEWLEAGAVGNPPKKNIITQALGVSDDVAPDIVDQAIEGRDVFLLCSDGLTAMVPDEEIKRHVATARDRGPETVCRTLIDLAKENGGSDNITVVVAVCL